MPPPGWTDNWDHRSLLFPHYGREQGHWLNYVLSPYMRVLWEHPDLPLSGADITFGPATVPFRAGTSSSSAVVVLSFLALYLANKATSPALDGHRGLQAARRSGMVCRHAWRRQRSDDHSAQHRQQRQL